MVGKRCRRDGAHCRAVGVADIDSARRTRSNRKSELAWSGEKAIRRSIRAHSPRPWRGRACPSPAGRETCRGSARSTPRRSDRKRERATCLLRALTVQVDSRRHRSRRSAGFSDTPAVHHVAGETAGPLPVSAPKRASVIRCDEVRTCAASVSMRCWNTGSWRDRVDMRCRGARSCRTGSLLASTRTRMLMPGPPRCDVHRRVVQIQPARRELVGHHIELPGEIEVLFHHELQRGVGVAGGDDRHDRELRQRDPAAPVPTSTVPSMLSSGGVVTGAVRWRGRWSIDERKKGERRENKGGYGSSMSFASAPVLALECEGLRGGEQIG